MIMMPSSPSTAHPPYGTVPHPNSMPAAAMMIPQAVQYFHGQPAPQVQGLQFYSVGGGVGVPPGAMMVYPQPVRAAEAAPHQGGAFFFSPVGNLLQVPQVQAPRDVPASPSASPNRAPPTSTPTRSYGAPAINLAGYGGAGGLACASARTPTTNLANCSGGAFSPTGFRLVSPEHQMPAPRAMATDDSEDDASSPEVAAINGAEPPSKTRKTPTKRRTSKTKTSQRKQPAKKAERRHSAAKKKQDSVDRMKSLMLEKHKAKKKAEALAKQLEAEIQKINAEKRQAEAEMEEDEVFNCMKEVKWPFRKVLPPDEELKQHSFDFCRDLSKCNRCWSIQGKRTSCTCVKELRDKPELILYLARLKCVVEKMRVTNEPMYDHYVKLLIKEHTDDLKRGVMPYPRLPKEDDAEGLSMSDILPDLANRRICKGLWRKIVGVPKLKYEEFEKNVVFSKNRAMEAVVNKDMSSQDIDYLLDCAFSCSGLGGGSSGSFAELARRGAGDGEGVPRTIGDEGSHISNTSGSHISALSQFSFSKYI